MQCINEWKAWQSELSAFYCTWLLGDHGRGPEHSERPLGPNGHALGYMSMYAHGSWQSRAVPLTHQVREIFILSF
jgi:hypothetical protein